MGSWPGTSSNRFPSSHRLRSHCLRCSGSAQQPAYELVADGTSLSRHRQIFAQAARAAAYGGKGRLVVDRPLCKACGQNGAIKSMASRMGLESLEIVTPTEHFTLYLDE
jgi:hypothetical protein